MVGLATVIGRRMARSVAGAKLESLGNVSEQNYHTMNSTIPERIAATEHLLSLYNSPFPDAWERAKRAELIAQINEFNRQLEETTSVPSPSKSSPVSE